VNEDLISRVQRIIAFYGLTVSAFADKVGVQRSSISHLLSGRNKPSLDFVLKLVQAFPDVNLYWFLKGEGNFPDDSITDGSDAAEQVDMVTESTHTIRTELPLPTNTKNKSEPVKIVLFYQDGTFESFHSKND